MACPVPKKQDQNQMRIGIIKKLKSPRKNLLICSRPSERSEAKPNPALTAEEITHLNFHQAFLDDTRHLVLALLMAYSHVPRTGKIPHEKLLQGFDFMVPCEHSPWIYTKML